MSVNDCSASAVNGGINAASVDSFAMCLDRGQLTSQLICSDWFSQLTGFYMMSTLVFNELILFVYNNINTEKKKLFVARMIF